jgi:hypothetical protein
MADGAITVMMRLVAVAMAMFARKFKINRVIVIAGGHPLVKLRIAMQQP